MSDRPRTGIDKQMLVINDRIAMKAILEDLGDDGRALLIARRGTPDADGNTLQVISYGEGQESEFLGLLSYGQAILYRTYFQDDD